MHAICLVFIQLLPVPTSCSSFNRNSRYASGECGRAASASDAVEAAADAFCFFDCLTCFCLFNAAGCVADGGWLESDAVEKEREQEWEWETQRAAALA